MREHVIRPWIVAVLVVLASARAEAACVDATTLVRSTVNLVRIFGTGENAADPDHYGSAGTGWFLSSRSLVTAAHVAEGMHLSMREWTAVEIRDQKGTTPALARISHRLGSGAEKIAVLELGAEFPDVTILPVRSAPLVADETVASIAYPGRTLRFAGGRFVRIGTDEAVAGAALLEMHDGNDRLVLDHGASGAPVLDCEGRVVAVVTNMLSQTVSLFSQTIRISTAWRTPNVVAIPATPLRQHTPPE